MMHWISFMSGEYVFQAHFASALTEPLARVRRVIMREEILARIPQETPDHVLEVALLHDSAERRSLELRSLWCGAGVGWYCQPTLRLGVPQHTRCYGREARGEAAAGCRLTVRLSAYPGWIDCVVLSWLSPPSWPWRVGVRARRHEVGHVVALVSAIWS